MKNIVIATVLLLLVAAAGYGFTKQDFGGTSEDTATVGSGGVAGTRSVLDLSGQGLTKAPAYIFDRTDIENLNLSRNAITGALQAEVRRLQNLKVLDLSDNKFTGVPAEIGQLKKLEVLDLSNNELTGLPYELGSLSRLQLLDVSGNAYSEADLLKIKESLPSSTVIKTK
ncbi:leucine-rich repeat domain-containing protein [Candidatus Kaiserbacteria bacterium]|nr:leucine-rich repeat domain-containing protein [Candidatus Kaiserbacteria bacterium]